MVEIETIDEANEVLASYVPLAKDLLGKDITLERMWPLMERLGNPQNSLKVVHLAGTSGKSSTAYYVASLLQQAGQKVGLTISPHMDSVAERIQIDLHPLGEKQFCRALSEFLGLTQGFEPRPSYFELMIGFVLWFFAKNKVDYAVVETGLGGLHDATNVTNLPNKVCIITDIGFDHMHVLGNTISEIAAQKAGIIHPGNQVFMFSQSNEINNVIGSYASQQNAPLTIKQEQLARKELESPPLLQQLPLYQQRNWLLAYKAFNFITNRDGLPGLSQQELASSIATKVPGRMEIANINGSTIIMDGAHNAPKMEAFIKSFQAKFPGQKAAILLSLKQGKEFQEVLPLLRPIAAHLILTTFSSSQDLPTGPIEPEILAKTAEKAGIPNINIEPDQKLAYQQLMDTPEDIKIITGSFYLLSQIRRIAFSAY
ncbi:MAG: Mur ligase family protein [Patescibacteria group bacterium]